MNTYKSQLVIEASKQLEQVIETEERHRLIQVVAKNLITDLEDFLIDTIRITTMSESDFIKAKKLLRVMKNQIKSSTGEILNVTI